MQGFINAITDPTVIWSGAGIAFLGVVVAILKWVILPKPKPDDTTATVLTDRFQKIAEEHGVAKAALEHFFQETDMQDVPPHEWDQRLQAFAKRLRDLEQDLSEAKSGDDRISALRAEAKAALEKGDFDRADALLGQAETHGTEQRDDGAMAAAESAGERGKLAQTRFKFLEAAKHFDRAAELAPPEWPEVRAEYLLQAGYVLFDGGKYEDALARADQSVKLLEQAVGPDDPKLAWGLNDVAASYRAIARNDKAEPLMQRAVKIFTDSLGPDHPNTRTVAQNLAILRAEMGAGEP